MKELIGLGLVVGAAYLIYKRMKEKAEALKVAMQAEIDAAKENVKTEIQTVIKTIEPDPNRDNWHS